MPATRQLRLLLWKDYLTRKRKLITLAGVLWATAVILCIYIVRANVDNADYSTCQFPARALPSAGMLPFLQSFLCSVNNDCQSLDKFDEIPTYEDAKLTQIQRQISPLLYNDTVLDVAGSVPDGLKLLSKLADIVDDPTFVDISKNGLKVEDLFINPVRVKRYISSRLSLNNDVMDSLMTSQLSFQGIFKGSPNRCNIESISETIIMENVPNMEILAEALCKLSDKDVQRILMDLLTDIDFNKFIKMVGSMYFKLTGDLRVKQLADTVTAVLRVTRMENFLPKIISTFIKGEEVDFSYFDMELIKKLVDLFEPTFGDTESFNSIKEVADTVVLGAQYLSKFWNKQANTSEDVTSKTKDIKTKSMSKTLSNAVEVFDENSSIDIFSILTHIAKLIHKTLPDDLKHDVLLYSTLLSKLIESANKVININMNIEERAYNVTLRHTDAVNTLVNLPIEIVAKGFDALADAERTQVMTAKISNPGQMFCDLNRLQGFFKISKDEATSLRNQLCTDVWKNYVTDLLATFGIHEVKDNINSMASLLIQETLGKDTSDQLYSIDRDFETLKNFSNSITGVMKSGSEEVDWIKLFNVTEESELMKTVRSKGHLGKQMLIVVHGALAKEVVKQNPILSYKISPRLIDITILVTAMNDQIDATSKTLVENVKKMYPKILETVIRTANDEDKTYKSLSTHSEVILCQGLDDASNYVILPPNVEQEDLVETMCNISKAIEMGLDKDSIFGKAIENIRNSNRSIFEDVKWTALISGLKNLYVKLDRDYPYLFEYSSFGLDKKSKVEMEKMVEDARKLWFGDGNLGKSVHLGLKFGFRLLDLLDRDIFNISGLGWGKMKYAMYSLSGPLLITDDFISTVSAIYRNETFMSNLPISTVEALNLIVPNIPQLMMDGTDIIIKDDVELPPLLSLLNSEPPWPCSTTSLSQLLPLSPRSSDAVKGLETIWCMDRNFTDEWAQYLDGNRVEMFDMKNWNTTAYPPHTFLKVSSAVDGLIRDGGLLKSMVEDITNETSPWSEAWLKIEELLRRDDRDVILKRFFTKFDEALSSITTVSSPVSLYNVWSEYLLCRGQHNGECRDTARVAWKKSLQFFGILVKNLADDLMIYFNEMQDPNANILQVMGFTKDTTLYELYDKLPDFMGVLLHSYFDYGFMSQIRRAALSQFWDCEAVLNTMVPPPGSIIDEATLQRVKHYVCPSFLYWISLPRGDNKFLDIVAKPQYYFYTVSAENLTSSYQDAYTTVVELTNLLTEVANKNQTLITEEDIKMNSIQYKYEKLVDAIVDYKIDENDASYRRFYDINRNHIASAVYLTKIVSIVNKVASEIENILIDDINIAEDDKKIAEAELVAIKKIFKRRPIDIIELHFDALTDVIWQNNENYSLVDALEKACNNLKNNNTSKVILVENVRVKNQICSKKYEETYRVVEKQIRDDYEDARDSLLDLLKVLKADENETVTDIFAYFKEREQLLISLHKSIKHAYELHLPTYLQYLQSNLRHYDVITTFLAGGDWWTELRGVYNGPRANNFFNSVEISFEIVADVLNGLDRIHLVRLLRDINVNNSEAFCLPNITLSDYLPDSTGKLSQLKTELCEENTNDLFRELPPLLFASQGYDTDLKLPPYVNYSTLNLDIATTASNLNLLTEVKSPARPGWVTDDKLKALRQVAVKLLTKESLTRISFGLISNLVDAGTLFLNNSQCTMCSQLTSWINQINLQVFKKQEYDNLLCRMKDMTLNEVHRVIQNDFHWDMAVRELIQTRNYTKYELNKSMNEFLELVKLHLLEDMLAKSTKLTDCLARNVSRNAVGHATLVLNILAHTARLLRAQAPHLHKVDGFTELPYFIQLAAQVAHKLDVYVPLKKYLKSGADSEVKKMVEDEFKAAILGGDVNLKLVKENRTVDQYIRLQTKSWSDICSLHNCSEITDVLLSYINRSAVEIDLPKLQTEQFWHFTFVSRILYHVEGLLSHLARLVAVFSDVDLEGALEGRLAALIDLLLQLLGDDVSADIVYSLQGLVEELTPLLESTPLDHDLKALGTGLTILHQFKNYLLEKDLKVDVSTLFPHGDRVEMSLSRLGINNTNFWSLAAPRVHEGQIDFKPLLTLKHQEDHVSHFVCQMDSVSKVITPSNLDVVTLEDVNAAIVEQWCSISDDTAKQAVAVLVENMNYSFIMEKVANTLLPLLYSSANLTEEQGASVLDKYPQMAALLPVIQESVGDLGETIANEPLVQSLKSAGSVGGLLGSPEFLSNAGKMLCGKPFQTDENRFYKAIAASKDYSDEPDQAQLEVLPTDFCRDLYKDILSMDGGKIVWTFVKPLIMGKILYTPVNPTVDRIIRQANSTFAHMTKLVNLIHSFSGSFSSLDELSIHREGILALQRIISSPAFSDIRTMLLGDGEVPNVDEGLFDDLGDLKGLGSILKRASDLLRCINLDRFKPVPDEYQLTHEAVKLSQVNEFSAGLVFLDSEKKDYLKHVEYKIRMDIDNVPTTARMKNYLWIPGPESSFIEHMRYFRGFIQLQDMVDTAIIQLSRSNSSRQKRETRMEDKWTVYTQQEPYPCYRKDFFQTSLYESQALMVALFFSLLFTVASTVRFIVEDKESGNTMLMSVMGVDLSNHTLSWFFSSLLEMLVTVACMTIVLFAGGLLPHTDPTLVFALLVVFGLSVLAFCYMLSKLFKSASLGAVCSAIAYLMTFMPFVLILSLEAVLSSALKVVVCLSMSTSICYAFLNITRVEARGAGAGWSELWVSAEDDLSIGAAAAMALFDAGLYFAVGLLIDRFFGPKTLKSNITNLITSDEKAGVSIVNVTKIYKHGSKRQKMALDNVSIELHKGQITTLLGHNGAGKTTLINILTGMIKPTSGSVIVRSERADGTALGVCPQKDVLFECLSAAEHIALYAQLKTGMSAQELRDEVDSMLSVLSLGAISLEPVSRLSGGTRRRVCVALAFVGRPKLVSLDEPTAGVDPAARRDIWSMIVKLREDRTILLTTHHLDEAELLSDQIVIMHKGQVHTTGSPIEIKRSLGNGYKLTVTYPKTSDPWPDSISIEEKTKHLLTVVRENIKNANLAEVNGLEVEMTLPFFDSNGLNNDFLRLCSSLESKQEELGFRSYSLDCASLEQVFFNICQQVETPSHAAIQYDPEIPSKSASTSSVRSDNTPLVTADGPLKGTSWHQFTALLHARYLHYIRNRWLLFLLVVLPTVFIATAMAFSLIRPPADNEVALRLYTDLYPDTTQYLVPKPSIYSNIDSTFAEQVLQYLRTDRQTRNWTSLDTPNCTCSETRQDCNSSELKQRPKMMQLPDVKTLNEWIVTSHDDYIEKRYGGFTAALKNNMTYLIAWYNNKGHHTMPAVVAALHSAALKATSGDGTANITVRSHPLKISQEQLSKDTVYQHIADAGISALVLIAYCLVVGGAAVYAVTARRSHLKRLQLLCGVTPTQYCMADMVTDMTVIVINMIITVIIFEAFGFPVFVARNNLAAICLLILLFGYSCSSLVHILEKLFSEASLANMVLFCGNTFVGLAGITLLLILDIISDSDATDNARWTLHKILLVCPQFVLGDGMLEIAKNTIQAQVLNRFGMDTYKDPLTSDLIAYHYIALALTGTALFLLNLAVEYDCFEVVLSRLRSESIPEESSGELEPLEVSSERRRVLESLRQDRPHRLPTLGNINAGFIDTEVKNNSIKRYVSGSCDVAQCAGLGKAHRALTGHRVAVRDLTIGIPSSQCTALLGQNGAGKSTTFGMLTGEIRPTTGHIYLHEKKMTPRLLCQGLISYCPQSDAIDPLLTVRETLIFYCKLRGIDERDEVVKRTLEMFDITKYADVRNGTLSGGNKRKLCTAIAFMGRTPLVLLDEPTSGMDPVSRGCVSRGVSAGAGGGRAVLLSTHALEDARRLAARVALMRHGRLCALAPLDDCLNRFGGGYIVACRCVSSRAVWRRVRSVAPHAKLRVLHTHALHFLLPTRANVDKQEIVTNLSDIFRLMAQLQTVCDIEDYTINQSSLDQMFLSFTDKGDEELEPTDLEPLPSVTSHGDELNSITSL